QKSRQALLVDVVKSAGDVADPNIVWRDLAPRIATAKLLGRVVGFLANPKTTFVEPAALEKAEVEVEKKLGSAYVANYLEGIESFKTAFNALASDGEEKAVDASDRRQAQTSAMLERLKSRSNEAKRTTETLNVSKNELKSKFEAEWKEIDEKLSSLNEEKAELTNSTKKLEQMIQQTRLDIARLQTK